MTAIADLFFALRVLIGAFLATGAGAGIVGKAQLSRNKALLYQLSKRMKGPHAAREPYGDLRYLHAVLNDTVLSRTLGAEQLWDLVGERLGQYSTSKGDPARSLEALFRRWTQSATT